MKNNFIRIVIISLFAMFAVSRAMGAELDTGHADFLKKFKQNFPGVKPDSVKKGPVEGLYEVVIGAKFVYMSQDARYLVLANIIDLKAGENLTRPKIHQARLDALGRIGDEGMVIFSPPKPKYTVSAFTDIDCGYCRKMHSEMKQYNDLGIAIRYLFYPARGIGSESHKKAVSVWCSKDRKQAMTDAKAGKAVTDQNCDNPVNKHMLLVQQLGLRGTPAMVLPSGEVIESYIPAPRLLEILQSPPAQ